MNKDIIPLLVSILLALFTLAVVLFTDYTINPKHYIGFGTLVLSVFLYFKKKKVYRYFFATTLTVGLFGFLDFFFASFKIGINIVEVNPLFLMLLILFLVFADYESRPLAKDEGKFDEQLVEVYKKRYSNKTETELIKIADKNSKYVIEAKIASNSILEKKYRKH